MGENSASGFGHLAQAWADDLFETVWKLLTGGNHIWDRKEIPRLPSQAKPRLLAAGKISADINPGKRIVRSAKPENGVALRGAKTCRGPSVPWRLNDCSLPGQPIGRLPASH